jgi:hypothetical protein
MATKRWTFACALAIVTATSNGAFAQDPAGVKDLARAGHEKKLAGLTLIIGGSALVVTGVGLAVAGLSSDDHTRCHTSGGFYYFSERVDGITTNNVGEPCWNQALVVAGGTTWLVGALTLGIGIPVYVIGMRQLRDAARLRRWLLPPSPPPAYTPPPPPNAPPLYAPPPP